MGRPSHNYNLRDRKKLQDQQQARNEEIQRKAEVEEQARQQRAEARRTKKRREEVEESSSSSEESDMESVPTAASRADRNKARPPQKKRQRRSDPDYYPSSRRDRKWGRVEEEDSSSSGSSDEDEDKPFQGFRKDRNGSKLVEFQNHQVTHTLDDLQGIQEIKQKVLGALVYPFCNQKKADILKLKPQKGVLLSGKPGTGKSRLADAIVNEIRDQGVNVVYYKESGTCLSKYVGESERNLRKLFATAKENAPSVIFLDEIDGIGGKRRVNDASSSHNTILTTLLVELNQMEPGKVVLIAATNCPENCDAALVRKGRFDLHIEIPLPNEANRREILSFYLDNIEVNLSEAMMQKLVVHTEGNTGSDLESLVGELHQEAIDKLFPNGSYRNMPNRQIRERKEDLLEDTMEELINERWEEEVDDEEEQEDLDEEEMDEESEDDESEENEDFNSEEEKDEESESEDDESEEEVGDNEE